ncbi:conserved hypothetical protein [Phenylobacterium zucineum HLK1]|uniref:Glycerophosphoryl diester phosphodiesterase membrane domain-containing protein n=1 Tax=Phenylobacterium zucineum (strain HLK1) TaxID=450851 RepID=B4RDW8_PHEZH|nr:hypothetical protein [Phenylobacterium zucineum]ACG76817.1 conserved hypothetical protein [Phenylobacterium zucineum HLK1]
MGGFSIEAALKSGFGLARREPLAVLAWGAGYMLFGLVMQALSLGGDLPEYLRLMTEDPEAAAALVDSRAESRALLVLPVMLILSLLLNAALYGAVARALLRPQERSFFFLRLGRGELWLMLTSIALALLAILVVLPVAGLAAFATGLLSGATGATPLIWGLLLGLPLLAACLYFASRFSLAWVQAFDEERFVLLDAWRLTRGQGWRIVLTMLALAFLLLIIAVVVVIPAVIVGGIVLSVAGATGGGVVMLVVLGLAALAFFSALYGLLYTVMAAAYVEIYRSLAVRAA